MAVAVVVVAVVVMAVVVVAVETRSYNMQRAFGSNLQRDLA